MPRGRIDRPALGQSPAGTAARRPRSTAASIAASARRRRRASNAETPRASSPSARQRRHERAQPRAGETRVAVGGVSAKAMSAACKRRDQPRLRHIEQRPDQEDHAAQRASTARHAASPVMPLPRAMRIRTVSAWSSQRVRGQDAARTRSRGRLRRAGDNAHARAPPAGRSSACVRVQRRVRWATPSWRASRLTAAASRRDSGRRP